jgi:hypothetical protein
MRGQQDGGFPMMAAWPAPEPVRPDRAREDSISPAPLWRASAIMTGGASGVLGVGAVTAHLVDVGVRTTIYFCASSAICALITGAVAIVSIIAGRAPEIRRTAALQHLARKSDTPADRKCAMAMLALDSAIVRSEIKDPTKLVQVLLAEAKG